MEEKDDKLKHLIKENPLHFYTEEELDAIEAIDPALALRIDRSQHFAHSATDSYDPTVPIDPDEVKVAIDEARRILAQDGGDIEFVDIRDRTVIVRLKGACVGCPSSAIDLKSVVERLVKSRSKGVKEVVNVF